VAQATGSPLLIYSEFGTNSDAIWAARADDLSQRIPIASVAHAAEYGINAALSPDGSHIAYTVLPTKASPAIDSPAEVWVMDSDGRHARRLATGADLPVAPVWAPDSSSVVFRRSSGGDSASSFQLVRVTLTGTETEMLDANEGVLPVGFSPEGALYYTQFSSAGTDLGQVPADGGASVSVAHLSDDFARDWHLSPDGSRLAFLAPRSSADGASFSAMVVGLDGGAESALKAATAVQAQDDEFNPIWRPNGELTIGRLDPTAPRAPVLRIAGDQPVGALAAPPLGFDVPLSWSPDGTYLAVRFFEGNSAANPGRSWVMVVSITGERHSVSANSDVAVLGWFGGGG
jgi:Tol biopolymer transport system component